MIVCVGQRCSGVGSCCFGAVAVWCGCILPLRRAVCGCFSAILLNFVPAVFCFMFVFGWVSNASEISYGFPNCRAITTVICGSGVWDFFAFGGWWVWVFRVYPAPFVICFLAYLVHLVRVLLNIFIFFQVLLNKIVLFKKKIPYP